MFANHLCIFLFLFIITKRIYGITYDEDLAYRLIHFSQAVYCINNDNLGSVYSFSSNIFDWECDTCDDIRSDSDITYVYAFQDTSLWTDTEVLITYDSSNNVITIAFAGSDTSEITDILTDLDLWRTEYPACAGYWWWEDDCTVHSGFYKAYKAVRSGVRSEVSDLLSQYPSAAIEITGHSLGGALAVLCGIDLAENGMTPDYIYTFGQPRVGDDEFVDYYDGVMGDNTIRVTHGKDPVPLVPWKGWPWNYLHSKSEVYYAGDAEGDYDTCDGSGEDDGCINQHNWWEILTDFNVVNDHLNYLDVTFDGQECNLFITSGDLIGNFSGYYNGSGNETVYGYEERFDVLLNWTHYGSVLWDSGDMNDGGIGEQWLIKWSLIEAAVNVNSYLTGDDDMQVVILNASQVDDSTILVSMTVAFEFDHQFNQFYCNLSYVIDYFNDNFKNLLGVDDTVEQALLHHYTEINNVDANCTYSLDSDEDSDEENESSNSGGEYIGESVARILIIVAIGFFVVAVIGSFYYYKRNEYARARKKSKDNKDLSSKDQFGKATFNPHQVERVKSHESTAVSGTL